MVICLCRLEAMKHIAASKFKATCLALIDEVNKSGKPILITKFGEPVAQLVPAPAQPKKRRVLGSMRGMFKITGDIVAPVCDPEEWEAVGD